MHEYAPEMFYALRKIENLLYGAVYCRAGFVSLMPHSQSVKLHTDVTGTGEIVTQLQNE